jgi:hypothetical protein
MNFCNGQSLEDPEIEQVGKEHVPLEYCDDAHDNERVERKEKVLVNLSPVRRWSREPNQVMISHEREKGVVVRPHRRQVRQFRG